MDLKNDAKKGASDVSTLCSRCGREIYGSVMTVYENGWTFEFCRPCLKAYMDFRGFTAKEEDEENE